MTAKTGNSKRNSRFLHCDVHDETVSIFGRNDGIGGWTILVGEKRRPESLCSPAVLCGAAVFVELLFDGVAGGVAVLDWAEV